MINRRLFLQTSSATLASIASTNPALAKGIIKDKDKGSVFDLVLFDDQHKESVDFATDAKKNGATIGVVHEDLNEEAYDLLTSHFSSQRSIIAGYTREHTAGYILALARDHAYQQVHFSELEPELQLLLKENSQKKLVAWVLAPLYTTNNS
ncbi:MAG: hypothetical protein P8M72_07530 [Gammaproteobacteria bacterium]|nr:hypothetical protein [Gammaproteobacteria bacterium]